MKKILLFGMAVFLVFGFVSGAKAAYSDPHPTDLLPSASFWAIDGDGNNKVTLSSTLPTNGSVMYRYGSMAEYAYLTPTTEITVTGGGSQVFLKFVSPGSPGYEISQALMSYMGKLHNDDAGSSLYHTLTALFVHNQQGALSTSTAGGIDSVSPYPVPLPGAAWFLGSGIGGLVGVRRKIWG